MGFSTCKVNFLKSIGVHGIGDMNALKLIIDFGMWCFHFCACTIVWDSGCYDWYVDVNKLKCFPPCILF